MNGCPEYDVVIIGGGLAGSCAALRLLSLGHKVALIEQEFFPRRQVGESLSPGVCNIFDYLQADHLLYRHGFLHNLPALVIWETTEPVNVSAEQRGHGIMADRGKLDNDMIMLAVDKGLTMFQPAKLISSYNADAIWQLEFKQNNISKKISATFVIDARGRKGVKEKDKIMTAPAMVALHADTTVPRMPATIVEAISDGWIWGSPLPGKQFRTMVFLRPETIKNKSLEAVFNDHVAGASLFKHSFKKVSAKSIKACSVQHYCHYEPWQNNYIRVGEAAFTLDPLSSTGVEKAMRCSLQAVIAINSVLKNGEKQMAKFFYEDRMIESIANHMIWTSNYYNKAWPGQHHFFWKERSDCYVGRQKNKMPFYEKLDTRLQSIKKRVAPSNGNFSDPGFVLNNLWHEEIKISPDMTYHQTTCVVDDLLALKTAIMHPGLEREIAYYENMEIVPLLSMIGLQESLGEIIYKWSMVSSFEKASAIATFLLYSGVITKAG